MLYAVIADIHGNYSALQAVIADAIDRGAESFLLLGDYIRDTPNLNEVVDTIRNLPNCTAILGNGDIGIVSLDDTKPDQCDYEQMYPNFWTYHNLSVNNLAYLKSLEESADITLLNGKVVHMSHSIGLIAHSPRLSAYHSGDYARKMETAPFDFEDGVSEMKCIAEMYSDEVSQYPGDICLYGHNHLQFLSQIGSKILCNPGSCGLPADYDIRAPYAIISDENDAINIYLQRVKYDVEQTISEIKKFKVYPHALFWGKLRISALRTGSDIAMSQFWRHAREIGGGVYPMDNEVWRRAVTTFYFDPKWRAD